MAPDHASDRAVDGRGTPRPATADPTTLASPAGDSAPRAPRLGPLAPRLGNDCWFLSGPTASGKTSLAIDLAGRLGAEIVSVDSMAVYRGLDIGTAKPTPGQRTAAPHHLIDVVPASESYSVARWLADAAVAVEGCRARNKRILFAGGTPLYLRALRDGLAPLPAGDPEFRSRLVAEAAEAGSAALHARLAAVDPRAAARIHPHDTRRIIRGLEVEHTGGRPLSDAFAPAPHPVFATQMMILDVPRAELARRIDQRASEMFDGGLVEEVRAAEALPGGIGFTARQAAGYAESLDLLAGRLTLSEALRRTQQRTRQLAKRQLTWLRSFREAVWIAA